MSPVASQDPCCGPTLSKPLAYLVVNLLVHAVCSVQRDSATCWFFGVGFQQAAIQRNRFLELGSSMQNERYEQAQDAIRFVEDNLGSLWDKLNTTTPLVCKLLPQKVSGFLCHEFRAQT